MERVWIELVRDESERIGMRGVCLCFICVLLESYIMFLQSLQCAMDDNVKLCQAMFMTLLKWLQNVFGQHNNYLDFTLTSGNINTIIVI